MNKKIKFVYKNIIRYTVGFILSLIIKRDSKICIMSQHTGKDLFLHNVKYLFLHMQNRSDLKFIWVCDDKQMLKKFKERGIKNVYSRKSLRGFYYTLKAKYWFYDYKATSISDYWSYGAVLINLWHGSGALKKIEKDAFSKIYNFAPNSLQGKILSLLNLKDDYFVVNSELEKEARKSAFLAKDDQVKILGSPRCDCLYKDFLNQDIFMEKDYENIREFKQNGRKIILYVPTFRDTGKNIFSWLKSDKLKPFLEENNAILVCKLHPVDVNSLNFETSANIYKMDVDSDILAIMKYVDVMITDYSSAFYEYLLLNRPIVYYIPDIEEYTNQCRGFYEPYENITAGNYTYTEEELLLAINDLLHGKDLYSEKRKLLCNRVFKSQDGNNCERVIEWIKSLNKEGN